jgi:hypothetical protein
MTKYKKYIETEVRYRNRPDVKSYQKAYQKLYRSFVKGEISSIEFDYLKPKKSDFILNFENDLVD